MSGHEVNLEGKRRVETELLHRGAASVISIGNRKKFFKVTNADNDRTVTIYVKTKRKGNWHTKTEEAKPADGSLASKNESDFWVFVDLSSAPKYWIAPDWWIRNDIFEAHQRFLEKNGGHRPKNDDSNHHSIEETRIEQWEDRWEILEIF